VTGHSHVPRAKHDRYRSPPTNYVQLLQHIARSRDVTGLSRLVKQYGPKFDAVHVSAAVSRLPRLYAPVGPGRHLNKDQRKERKQRAARLAAHLQVQRVCVGGGGRGAAEGGREGGGGACVAARSKQADALRGRRPLPGMPHH
jgi:hypothetical protein